MVNMKDDNYTFTKPFLIGSITVKTADFENAVPQFEITGETLTEQIACFVEARRRYRDAILTGAGLEPKEWNRVMDGVVKKTGKFTAEEWEIMNEYQRRWLQDYKRCLDRK